MVVRVTATLPSGVVLAVEGDDPLPRETLEFVILEAVARLQSGVIPALDVAIPATPPRRNTRNAQTNAQNRASGSPHPGAGTGGGPEPDVRAAPPASERPPVRQKTALQPINAQPLSPVAGTAPAQASATESPSGVGQSQDALADYCRSRDPRNAMRRVVTLIEGASATEGQPSVSVDALPELFRRVGWEAPENVSQVVRNAARTQYGWLQRDPLRPGHYLVTDAGRAAVLQG